jgi:hypothetical protein
VDHKQQEQRTRHTVTASGVDSVRQYAIADGGQGQRHQSVENVFDVPQVRCVLEHPQDAHNPR